MECRLFLDTNALLNLGSNAFKENFVIAQKTLEEIENIKSSGSKDGEIKYKARNCARLLNENEDKYEVISYSSAIKEIIDKHYLDETPDNIILASAHFYNQSSPIVVCTDDLNCRFISRNIFKLHTKGITELNLVKNLEEYRGYKTLVLNDEEMSYFYTHLKENIYDCLVNEYLIICKSDGEVVDYRRWNGEEYDALSYKQISSRFLGKIKPRNPEQVLAFDMLQNKNITIKVLSGGYGTGKTMLTLSNALKLIEDGKYDKLVYIRNVVHVKDSVDIGALPGTKEEKIAWGASPLADHLGGQNGLDMYTMSGTIEIENLGFIRGRDFKNSILILGEAENLTKEQVQLLIGRVGEGSTLWLDGDVKQTDNPIFRNNSGFVSAIQKLAGHEKFGYVQLQKTERSETAAMADLLD